MVKINPSLSKLEWEIMSYIWKKNEQLAVRDVLAGLYPRNEKAYTTVQTVMNTLVQKKVLSKNKIGLVNFYFPILKKKDLMEHEINSIAKQLFSGSKFSMANYLIKETDLNEDEIQELRKIIKEKQEK